MPRRLRRPHVPFPGRDRADPFARRTNPNSLRGALVGRLWSRARHAGDARYLQYWALLNVSGM